MIEFTAIRDNADVTGAANLHRTRALSGVSTRQAVYDVLRREIVQLELRPGAPLSEAEIGARFGVSRTPVRESLLMLAKEGLVEVFPQRGSFVGPIDYEDVVLAQFIREAIECAALERGAAAIDVEAVESLRTLLAEQQAADAQGDAGEFFRLDEAFHRALIAAGGRGRAWSIVSEAKAHMDRARRLSLPADGKMTELITQHTRIVDALANREFDTAVDELRNHLRIVLLDIERIREDHAELFQARVD